MNSSIVGFYAKETMPNIQQVFVRVAREENVDDIERELYICRKLIEKAVKSEQWKDDFYFCSLSSQTIVYKGMLRSEALGSFYSDLKDSLYKSPFAIYHRRYSTNTSPRWPLAQPMRLLGHNGEINTIQVSDFHISFFYLLSVVSPRMNWCLCKCKFILMLILKRKCFSRVTLTGCSLEKQQLSPLFGVVVKMKFVLMVTRRHQIQQTLIVQQRYEPNISMGFILF